MIRHQPFPTLLAIFLFFAILATSLPSLARAQAGSTGLDLSASAAFDGHFKYGEWLPVWIQLENRGQDLTGELRVRVPDSLGGTTYATPVDLPTGSRKRFPLYVLPNNYTHELEAQFVNENGQLAVQKFTVRPQPNINYMIGILAQEHGALSLVKSANLAGANRRIVVVNLSLSDLPERLEGLRSFDAMVVNGVDTSSLTPAQKDVLKGWVQQGGRLVIGGGTRAQSTASGFPEEIIPLVPKHTIELDQLTGLEEFAGGKEIRVPGPFVAATGEEPRGRTLAEIEGIPLVQELVLGKGYVDFVALDLASSPFDAWSGTVDLWEKLLSPGARYPQWMPPDLSVRQQRASIMTYPLTNLPSLDLPSVRSLSILLGVYILLVGPANYLVLRWRQRLHLAWLTIPAITLAFSAGAFGLGYALRGTDLILNKIAIVEAGAQDTASVSAYIGLFSPSQQSYNLEVEGNPLLSPLRQDYDPWLDGPDLQVGGERSFIQSSPARIRGLAVNQWSMQTFVMEGSWPGFGKIISDLTFEGNALMGTLRNDTAFTITDVVLILGNRFSLVGDFAPGEEKRVRVDVPELIAHLYESSIAYQIYSQYFEGPMPEETLRSVQLKQAVLESIFPWDSSYSFISGASASLIDPAGTPQALVLGWLDKAPPEVTVSGRKPAQQTSALLVAPVPFHFSEGKRLVLVPGLIPGRVIQMPVESEYCGHPSTQSIYLGSGSAVFEFEIPRAFAEIELESLVLYIGTEGGWEPVPDVAFYDWREADWQPAPGMTAGHNLFQEPQNLVSDEGLIHVRLSQPEMMYGCYYLGLGLEGSRP